MDDRAATHEFGTWHSIRALERGYRGAAPARAPGGRSLRAPTPPAGSPTLTCCASRTPGSGRAGVAIDRRRAVAALAGVDRGAERARDRSAFGRGRGAAPGGAAAHGAVAVRPAVCTATSRWRSRRAPAASWLECSIRATASDTGGHPALRARAAWLALCAAAEREAVLAHWRAAAAVESAHGGGPEARSTPSWRRRWRRRACGARRAFGGSFEDLAGFDDGFDAIAVRSSPMAGCAGDQPGVAAALRPAREGGGGASTDRPVGLRRGRSRLRSRRRASPGVTAAPSREPFSAGGALQAFHGVEVAGTRAWPGSRWGVGGAYCARLLPALALAGEQAEGEVELAGTGGGRACRAARARPRPRGGSCASSGQAEACAVERGFALQRAAQALPRADRVARAPARRG